MSVDRYTKLVLTVIAVCLAWLSVGGPALITPVSAQADRQSVYIAGWIGSDGRVRELGTPNHGRNEYVRGDIHTNAVDGFFSLLKRGDPTESSSTTQRRRSIARA